MIIARSVNPPTMTNPKYEAVKRTKKEQIYRNMILFTFSLR